MKNTTYWFRQRSFGLGATPNTWQSWLLTCVFLIFLVAMGFWGKSVQPNLYWSVTFIMVTSILLSLIWKKTEGGWQWRWGTNQDSNPPE